MIRAVRLSSVNDFEEWRLLARSLLLNGVPPDEVEWLDPAASPDMLSEPAAAAAAVVRRGVGRVPPRFIRLAQVVLCHSGPERFGLLYRLLWRLQKDRRVMFVLDDPDVSALNRRVEQVVTEYTRMKTELRFRRAVSADGHKGLAANFAPKHYVLERVAPHFTTAFAGEDWIIMTPYRSAFWDGKDLTYGPGRG